MGSGILTGPGLRTTAFYIAIFMVMGAHLPFWPLWLENWGLTAAEVGLFTALGMGIRVVAGLAVPAVADRLDRRGAVMVACLVASMALFVAHLWIGDRGVLLVATLAVGATLAGVGPLAEALGVAASREHRFGYAEARGLGSLGFLAANLIVGVLLARLGVGFVLWWIVGCLAVATALTLRHPGAGRAAGQEPPNLAEIGALMVNPVFALFLAAVAFSGRATRSTTRWGRCTGRGSGCRRRGSGRCGRLRSRRRSCSWCCSGLGPCGGSARFPRWRCRRRWGCCAGAR